MSGILRWYLRTPLMARMFGGFLLGSSLGIALWVLDASTGNPLAQSIAPAIAPFGTVFVNMLKMVVIPVVYLLTVRER